MKASKDLKRRLMSLLTGAVILMAAAHPAAGIESPWAAKEKIGPATEPVELNQYQHVVYVGAAASGAAASGEKSAPFASPAEALASIRDAGETNRYAVLVAAGVYPCNSLRMAPHVDLFGGFEPGGWTRDIFKNATILDGKKAGPVVLGADHARLDGFYVTGGQHRGHGGALVCEHVSPEISNNIFTDNAAVEPEDFHHDLPYQRGGEGGAIALITGCKAVVRNNIIGRNTTGVGTGGGIVVWNFSDPKILNNVICNNRSGLTEKAGDRHDASRSSAGGGIAVNFYCKPEISHNIIALNEAHGVSDAGAVYLEHEASAVMNGNWMVGNYGDDDGGAMYVMKTSEPVLDGNVVAGNRAAGSASGGIRLSVEGRMRAKNNFIVANMGGVNVTESYMVLENSVIADNQGQEAYTYNNTNDHIMPSILRKNIIWGNKPEPIKMMQVAVTGPPRVEHCAVQGGYAGEGNTDANPKFIDDSLRGQVTQVKFDSRQMTTTARIAGADLQKQRLTGRVINIGKQWSVIKSNDAESIVIWGEVTDGAPSFLVLGTYQLAPDSPCKGLGPRFD